MVNVTLQYIIDPNINMVHLSFDNLRILITPYCDKIQDVLCVLWPSMVQSFVLLKIIPRNPWPSFFMCLNGAGHTKRSFITVNLVCIIMSILWWDRKGWFNHQINFQYPRTPWVTRFIRILSPFSSSRNWYNNSFLSAVPTYHSYVRAVIELNDFPLKHIAANASLIRS